MTATACEGPYKKCSNPRTALHLVGHRTIHLLLTDLVMPLLGGLELARRVAVLSPQTKVLLMSGSALSDASTRRHPSIGKPFTPNDLAERVRQVLADGADTTATETG